jgi:hypothetical protein
LRYHQIVLKEEDQIKTVFITPFGTYAYKTMSFGLKNAGATYQRAIQMCFTDQLHQNVEAYVHDVVIRTKNPEDLITDLEETFNSLRRFRWKLNPTKCVFGVPSGKLLGLIVSNRVIEANPMKITAITNMEAPATIKDVQKLTGCVAALNRFISRLGEKGLPLFKLLKCQDKFQWMEEAKRALQDLNNTYSHPWSSQHHCREKIYYFILRRQLMSSAVPSLSSAARRAMRLECRGLCTLSVRYSPNLRYDTRQFKNFYMQY